MPDGVRSGLAGTSSGGRKRRLRPADLTEVQEALYAEIALGTRARDSPFPLVDAEGSLTGPFDALLLLPELGTAVEGLGLAIRFGGGLPARARELAILVTGHHHHSAFEVAAHEAAGRRAGLSESELASLAEGRDVGANALETLVSRVTRELVSTGALTDSSYQAAVDGLGEEGVFELTCIVGYYSMLAVQMRVFG